MRRFHHRAGVFFALALLILVAGCNGNPTREVTYGELLLSDDFDVAGQWDTAQKPAADVQVRNGVFRFEANSGRYIFSVDYRMQGDSITEVDAVHLSDDTSDGYGLMCRANASGDGYYFLIGSDGSATIRRGQGREVAPLVKWTQIGALNTNAANRIRVICDGDYLAMYVNDIFVGEVRDSLYMQGYTGLAVVTTRPGQRITVEFDALRVYGTR